MTTKWLRDFEFREDRNGQGYWFVSLPDRNSPESGNLRERFPTDVNMWLNKEDVSILKHLLLTSYSEGLIEGVQFGREESKK